VTCVSCDACPFRGYISKQLLARVYIKLEEYSKQAVSLRSAEEYKKSACEDLTCDLKTLCVL
jgi:hypothetical protein